MRFLHGHAHRVAPDGELLITPDTKYCFGCRTRLPRKSFRVRTKKRKRPKVDDPRDRYYTTPDDRCEPCSTIQRKEWEAKSDRYQHRSDYFRERYKTDPDFRQQCLDRAKRRRERIKEDPDLLAKRREVQRIAKREKEAQIKQEILLEQTDPLCLRPGDPVGLAAITEAIAYHGSQGNMEQILGLSSNRLRRFRLGEVPIPIDLLDQILISAGIVIDETFHFERKSYWRRLKREAS